MDWFSLFSGFEGIAGYLAVLGTLIACGLGVPVPEDIILISGGYIASATAHPVWPMVATGLLGILLGDSATFWAGRRFGLSLAKTSLIGRYLTDERLSRVDGLFRRHGQKVLVAARFMPGVRAVTYFSAGAMKVPFWKFLLLDGLAALVSAPLWVVLGFRYGQVVVDWARQFSLVLLALGLAAFGGYVVARGLGARSRRAVDPTAPLPAPARAAAGEPAVEPWAEKRP
jgi:membrane protein DedA with SNARE-associated domain